jgi:acyl carrier protein
MTIKKEEVTKFILETLNNLIDTFPESDKFVPSNDTILFGPGSNIDSLSLVSFIVDLETTFPDKFSREISLTDDRAMTRQKSPFSSVNDLTEYIMEVVEDEKN